MKDLVAYCSECGKKTRHRIINCQTNACERAFLLYLLWAFLKLPGTTIIVNVQNAEILQLLKNKIIYKGA